MSVIPALMHALHPGAPAAMMLVPPPTHHELGHAAHEHDPLLLALDLGGRVGRRLVPLGQPDQHLGHQREVGAAEVLQRDEPRVAEGSHHLGEIWRCHSRRRRVSATPLLETAPQCSV